MKTILVPIDFSETAINAIGYAVEIAKKIKARITIFHIVKSPSEGSFNVMGEINMDTYPTGKHVFMSEIIKKVQHKINFIMEMPEYSKYVTRKIITVEKNSANIGEIIAEQKSDLIVMGTEGVVDGIEGTFLNSNAEQVISNSQCPVITVKKHTQFDGIDQVLYCSKFEEKHAIISEKVSDFCKIFDAKLYLLYINNEGSMMLSETVRSNMLDFAERNKLHNYTFNTISHKTVEEGVLAFADKMDVDIIALDAPETSLLGKILAKIGERSVASELVYTADRPVLAYNKNMEESKIA